MVPRRFNLEVEGSHVVEEPGGDEAVRIGADLSAVLGRAGKKAPDGAHGLQEGRHAEIVERCRHRFLLLERLLLAQLSAPWCAEDKDRSEPPKYIS
jgi:hypothetical protein